MRSESLISTAILLLGALLAGCSAGGGSSGGSAASAGSTGGFTASVTSGASSGQQGPSTGGQRATLRLSGTPGVKFSGRCTIGGKSKFIDGRTPASYAFETGGQRLSCRIQKQSTSGTLEVTFEAPGSHATQRINSPNGTLEITYRDGSLSVSQSSS